MLFFTSETSFKSSEPFVKVSKPIHARLKWFQSAELVGATYGTEFNDIAIITTILGEGLKNMWKERRLVRHKKKDADIRLEIDYDKFVNADEQTQALLYVKNIVDSIMVVEEKKKGDFKGLKLIDDILSTLGISKAELEKL